MKHFITLLALLSLTALSACTSEVLVEEDGTDDTNEDVVEENNTDDNTDDTSEDATHEQTFQSENGNFEYTLAWHDAYLSLADGQYEGSTDNAPSFDIPGGGHVSVATGMMDGEPYKLVNQLFYAGYSNWPTEADTVQMEGGPLAYPTYFFYDTNSACLINYGLIEGANGEALVIRMEDCDTNDMVSLNAFNGLFNDLVIE